MKQFLLFSAIILSAVIQAGTITFNCTVNQKSAIFKPGEKIVFTAKMAEDGKPVVRPLYIRYTLQYDTKTIKSGRVKADSVLSIETVAKRPGWVLLQLFAEEDYNDGKVVKSRPVTIEIIKRGEKRKNIVKGGIGAMVSPLEITPAVKEPEDFDAFWQNAKKELASVPLKVLEKKVVKKKNNIIIYNVKVSCAGDKPVTGVLCVPENARPGSLPAVVSFQGAGVSSANADISHAALGAITFNVNAHGIENGKPAKYYRDLRNNYYYTTLDAKRQKNYLRWNRDDRNKYYMRGMFIRVLRALEFVKSLPEWDGKHLAASGTSQGGTQTIAAAALDKDVTFARAGVPGWCDLSGVLACRRSGGGNVYSLEEVRANPVLEKETNYFDCMFLARRIKCPIYINTGFIDTTCPPSSVFAAYNQILPTTEKHMQTVPDKGHKSLHTQGLQALKEYIIKINHREKEK